MAKRKKQSRKKQSKKVKAKVEHGILNPAAMADRAVDKATSMWGF